MLIVLSGFCVKGLQASEIKNILVIHSYHQGLRWTDAISDGIMSVLNQPEINIHFEYLDTKRNTGEKYYQQLVLFEKEKKNLLNIEFELIICSDNNALRFIQENRKLLYPDIPIVFCGVNNFNDRLIEGEKKITGVLEYIDYKSTLELIRELHPERDNVLIILDRTPTGEAIKKEISSVIDEFSDHFTFEFYQDFILSDVPGKVSTLGDHDVIYLLTFNKDIKGNFISYHDGIEMIKKASDVPIYGAWDFYFNKGIVGGMLTTGFSQGEAAGKLASLILQGVPVEKLDIQTFSPNKFMFDYDELSHFGLSAGNLPEGSIIINSPEKWIEKHSRLIVVFSEFAVLCTIVLLVRSIQNRRDQRILIAMNRKLEMSVREKTSDLTENIKQVEIKNRELNEALEQIRTLKGIIPICSHCKNVRDDQGYWKKVEQYIFMNTDAVFSHSLCPECMEELYPEIVAEMRKQEFVSSEHSQCCN